MLCRNMRDLRELVCQSRLDYHALDDGSDADSIDTSRTTSSLLQGSVFDGSSVQCSMMNNVADELHLTNQDEWDTQPFSLQHRISFHDASHLPVDVSDHLAQTKQCKSKKPFARHVCTSEPLPPILSVNPSPSNKTHVTCDVKMTKSHSVLTPRTAASADFAMILSAIDVGIIASWLEQTNCTVARLSKWCRDPANFVTFAHFWLSEFSGVHRAGLIQMEHGIFSDRLASVFRHDTKIHPCHVNALAQAVLHEYPRRLLSAGGVHLILDFLDVLTSSSRGDRFKQMLSSVHCSTGCREHTEVVLALRAFALATILTAIVEFFQKLAADNVGIVGLGLNGTRDSRCDLSCDDIILEQRLYISIRNGFSDVLHFLIKSGRVSADFVDGHQRSLVFLGVLYKQPSVVTFLLTHVLCRNAIDVNRAADNGNTALHSAAGCGDVALVELLLSAHDIDVNAANFQANGATALHLAVMHGHKEVVHRLLEAGADRLLTAGGQTAAQIAVEFGHNDLLQLLDAEYDGN